MLKKLIASALALAAFAGCLSEPVQRPNGEACQPDWRNIEPDSIIWANPREGKPLRVLFLCWNNGTGEAMSVARRMQMDYKAFEVGCMWNLSENMKKAEKQQALLKLLQEDYDVCVMAGVGMAPAAFPPEIQYHLLRKIIDGMGLVNFGWGRISPFPEELTKKAALVPAAQVAPGLPFSLFRSLADAPEKTAPTIDEQGFFIPAGYSGRAGLPNYFGKEPLAASTLGKSRVVTLPFQQTGYVTRPNFVFPGNYTRDMYIYDEYHISMLCKAMLWAADRTPEASIAAIEPAGATLVLGKDVVATVKINASQDASLTLLLRTHDYRGVARLERSMAVSLKKGEQEIRLPLPLDNAGNYLLDIWLKDGDKVVDWGSGYFQLYGQGRIADVAVNDPGSLRRGGAMSGSVAVKDAAPGESLALSLVDSYDRILLTRSLEIKGDIVNFQFPLDENLAGIMFDLRCEIVLAGKTQFAADYHFPVPRNRPEYYADVAMGEDNSSFHLARMRRKLLAPYRFDGDHYINDAFGAAALAWDGWEINSAHAIPRITGWTLPFGTAAVTEAARKMAKALKPFGQRFAIPADDSAPAAQLTGIGDNSVRSHKDALSKKFKTVAELNKAYGYSLNSWDEFTNEFTRKCVERMFHEHLQSRYKTVAELNKAWGTLIDAWEQIDQKLVDEQKKQGNFAPEVEVVRFGERNYYDTFEKARQAAMEENPDVAIGHYASNIGEGLGEALEKINFLSPYWRDYLCEEVGAFYGKKPGYYGANGGYFEESGSAAERRLQPWYPLLSGLNCVQFWYTVERIGGDMTLTPLKIKIWLEEMNKIKSGIDKQVVDAHMRKDPVAILYSQASGFASQYDKKMAEIGNSCENFNAIFHDLGLQYHYIYGKHLLDGMLEKEKIKILVLPYCQALSDAEAGAVRAFAENGGTVIADLRPGIRDENCRLLGKGLLDDVFGISREKTDDYVRFGAMTSTKPLPGIPAGEKLCDVGVDTSVKLAGAQSHCDIGGSPAVIVNQVGKGRAILLNFFIGRYKLLQGDNLSHKLGALFEDLTQMAGVGDGRVQALTGGQKAVAARRVLFNNGDMDILGVCKRATAFEKFPLTVDLVLPETRHVYSMVDGKYFGKTDRFLDGFDAEQTKFYALLPYKVEKINLNIPGAVKKGEKLQVGITVKTDGAPAAPHVELIQIKDKDGQPLKWFERKITAVNGKAGVSLPIAVNEPSGKYTLTVTDIPTGIVAEEGFEIQ